MAKELPFTWSQGDSSVTPIYELREQGVGAVETIAEFNGMLIVMDLLEIPSEDLLDILNGPDPFGVYEDEIEGNRIRFKLAYSAIGFARRFGVTVTGSMGAASNTLTLNYKPFDWVIGTSLLVVGAGASSGNLTTVITNIVGLVISVDTPSVGAVTDEDVLQSTDFALAPVPGGSYELEDDSSGILRGLDLDGRLLVYKDTTIIAIRYTGDVNNPLDPEIIHRGSNLFWRWTLIKPKDKKLHIYAGEDDFKQFDLASQVPKDIPALKHSRNLFFDNVNSANRERIYASDNERTNEVWFQFPRRCPML